MKKDQEELQDTIGNILSTLSDEYIVDMFLIDYNKPIWHNLSSTNKTNYLDNTINTSHLQIQHHKVANFH